MYTRESQEEIKDRICDDIYNFPYQSRAAVSPCSIMFSITSLTEENIQQPFVKALLPTSTVDRTLYPSKVQ